jgi:hypothetical protein
LERRHDSRQGTDLEGDGREAHRREITYPVKGPFPNPLQAAAAGNAVLKALEERAAAGKD